MHPSARHLRPRRRARFGCPKGGSARLTNGSASTPLTRSRHPAPWYCSTALAGMRPRSLTARPGPTARHPAATPQIAGPENPDHQASATADRGQGNSLRSGPADILSPWTAGRVTKSPEPGCASNTRRQPPPPRLPGHGSGWRWRTEPFRKPRRRGLPLPSSESRYRSSQVAPSGAVACPPRSYRQTTCPIPVYARGRIPWES